MTTMVLALLFVLYIAYTCSHRVLIAPSVLFVFSFVLSTSWAWYFQKQWSLVPSRTTLIVVIGGCSLFVTVSTLTSFFCNYFLIRKPYHSKDFILKTNGYFISFILIFEIFVIFLSMRSVKNATGISSLSAAMYSYRHSIVFGQDVVAIPFYLKTFRTIVTALGYYFSYWFIKKIVSKRMADVPLLLIIGLSGYCNTLMGARTDAVILLMAMATMFYIFRSNRNDWVVKGNGRIILLVGVVTFIFLSTFKQLAVLQGRSIESSSIDYLAEYLGAEIKNLDTFIRQSTWPIITSMSHSQTLVYVTHMLGRLFHNDNMIYRLDLPFKMINGHDLGNVYTTFYAFMYDLGELGVVLFTSVMAFLTTIFYEKSKLRNDDKSTPLSVMIYSYMVSTLLLSFFSNKFYEQIFNSSFIEIILCWCVIDFVARSFMHKGRCA